MIFNVADLPAVRAQLERDAASQNDLNAVKHAQHDNETAPVTKNAGYPSKRLSLKNGHYHAVDVHKL